MNLSVTVVRCFFKPSLIKVFILIYWIIFIILLIILIVLKFIKLIRITLLIYLSVIVGICWMVMTQLLFLFQNMCHSFEKNIFILWCLIIKIFRCLNKRHSLFYLTFGILISYLISGIIETNYWNFIFYMCIIIYFFLSITIRL